MEGHPDVPMEADVAGPAAVEPIIAVPVPIVPPRPYALLNEDIESGVPEFKEAMNHRTSMLSFHYLVKEKAALPADVQNPALYTGRRTSCVYNHLRKGVIVFLTHTSVWAPVGVIANMLIDLEPEGLPNVRVVMIDPAPFRVAPPVENDVLAVMHYYKDMTTTMILDRPIRSYLAKRLREGFKRFIEELLLRPPGPVALPVRLFYNVRVVVHEITPYLEEPGDD